MSANSWGQGACTLPVMEIGEPKRTHTVEPIEVPIPELIPVPEPAVEPTLAEPVPATVPAGHEHDG